MKKTIVIALVYTGVFILISELTNGVVSTLWQYSISTQDSMTAGVIVESGYVTRRFGVQNYDIKYSYTVDKKNYIGDKVNYDTKGHGNSYGYLQKYPVGKEVSVMYDSRYPNFSVLETGGVSLKVYFYLIIWLLIAVLYYFIFKEE